jgi:hypothetical protein
MDPFVFVDALMEALTSRDRDHSKAAGRVLETLIDALFTLHEPSAAADLPVIGELAARLCHACYKVEYPYPYSSVCLCLSCPFYYVCRHIALAGN